MTQAEKIKSIILKNPLLYISIAQFVMVFLPAYVISSELTDERLALSFFESVVTFFGGLSGLMQLFVILAPIATVVFLFVKQLSDKKVLLIKISTIAGAVGCLFTIITVFSIKGQTADYENVSFGLGLWLTILLYVAEVYFVFLKDKKVNKEN